MDKQKHQPNFNLDKEAPITPDLVRQVIKSALIKMGDQATKEQKVELAKMLTLVFEQGKTPREAMKITEVELSHLYSAAFQLFSSGKFVEAREMFKMLITLEPYEPGFSVSLGACHHHLKDYEYALQAYLLASKLAPEDPVPLFYAYDCYKTLKDIPAAAIMLSNVVAKAGDNPVYAKVKERAAILLDELEKEIAHSAHPK
jgi:type III secretion system low calcium response chaperone LcrH/SycD